MSSELLRFRMSPVYSQLIPAPATQFGQISDGWGSVASRIHRCDPEPPDPPLISLVCAIPSACPC